MTEKGSIYAITQQENGQPDINILVIESSNVCISGGNLMCNSDVSINRELICNNGTFTTINASSTISGNLIGNVTSSGTSVELINAGGNWAVGMRKISTAGLTMTDGLHDHYLYLTTGGGTAGTYTAGKFVIKLYGAKF